METSNLTSDIYGIGVTIRNYNWKTRNPKLFFSLITTAYLIHKSVHSTFSKLILIRNANKYSLAPEWLTGSDTIGIRYWVRYFPRF